MTHASEQATATLREMILTGDLEPGFRLGEADLADRLQVSRTPVREALSRLTAEGLVEITPNRGARVIDLSADDIEQIFELRLRIEPHAVELAVGRLTDSELDELDELAVDMLQYRSDGPRQRSGELYELNARFHAILVAAADNRVLSLALRSVTHASVITQNFQKYSADALDRSLRHHVEIVAAARAGDGVWAANVMCSHLHNARLAMNPGTTVQDGSARD